MKFLEIWLKNVVMCGKYSLTKFENFLVYITVLCAEIVATFGSISTSDKNIENLQTLRGYIFHILQHFTTKFWDF